VGLSPRAALERVRQLESRGVISGYTALLDPAVLGYGVIALAAIELRENAARSRQALERVLKRAPEVVELQVVSGAADYLARIACPSLEAYEALTAGWLADPALGVARITTTFVLRSLKDFQGYPLPDAEAHDTI
jgi:DNA-binding Lrp family transcriptional regulator